MRWAGFADYFRSCDRWMLQTERAAFLILDQNDREWLLCIWSVYFGKLGALHLSYFILGTLAGGAVLSSWGDFLVFCGTLWSQRVKLFIVVWAEQCSVPAAGKESVSFFLWGPSARCMHGVTGINLEVSRLHTLPVWMASLWSLCTGLELGALFFSCK